MFLERRNWTTGKLKWLNERSTFIVIYINWKLF
jgi:hypothetical protein